MSTTSDAYVKKQPGNIVEKLNVLEQDDVHAMKEQLPTLYCKIVGRYSGFVIGKTTDPDDVFEEEPHSTFVEISEEEFNRDDD